MKGNVNPFEPWRPAQVKVPPPLHASRPWRPPAPRRCALGAAEKPPPIVEPVPTPRSGPPERLPQQPRQSGPPLRPARVRSSSSDGLHFALILVPLLAMAIAMVGAGMDWFHGSHLPRWLALGVCAVFLIMVAYSPRQRWSVRLAGMVVTLALAGLVAWFVPTTTGISLWSAYRHVDELNRLPAGDLAGYQRGALARKDVVVAFPSFALDVAAAEQAWLRRTVDELIEQTDRQLADDPQKALAELHRRSKGLESLSGYQLVKKDLDASHRRAVQACLQVVQK